MGKCTLGIVVLLVSLIAACAPLPPSYRAALQQNEGELHLYLQPIPQEAHRLAFSIAAISAIRRDGGAVQLQQSLTELDCAELTTVQKRLASGSLPPGVYDGLLIQIGSASLHGEEGAASLLIPEDPLLIEGEFAISPRRASTLLLSLGAERLLSSGFRLTPAFSLATPRRQLRRLLGFATSSGGNVVAAFNKLTMQVVDTVATGSGPTAAVLDQRRGWVYVALAGDDAIEAIEVGTGEILSRARLHFGDEPRELALTPDGETLVSANYGSNTASIIKTLPLREAVRVQLPSDATSVVVSPSAPRAYVLHARSHSISVIDLVGLRLTTTRTIDESPVRAAISENGDSLYVITRDSPNLLVLDPVSLTVTGRIFIGPGAASIKVDPKTDLVYVGTSAGDIAVVDPDFLTSIDMIRVSGNAAFLDIDNDENTLFVVSPDTQTVQKLNLVSKRVLGAVELSEGGYSVVLMGRR